jgi:hypothetical protein
MAQIIFMYDKTDRTEEGIILVYFNRESLITNKTHYPRINLYAHMTHCLDPRVPQLRFTMNVFIM